MTHSMARFAALLCTVIALGGATVALATWLAPSALGWIMLPVLALSVIARRLHQRQRSDA